MTHTTGTCDAVFAICDHSNSFCFSDRIFGYLDIRYPFWVVSDEAKQLLKDSFIEACKDSSLTNQFQDTALSMLYLDANSEEHLMGK